jgi:hypothetical protein
MSDLICDCTVGTPLVMGDFPNNCGAEDYGYPYLLLFMKPEGVITGCTGGVVGVGMIQAAQAEADQDRIIVVGPITNGQRIESERATEDGADTIDGMTNVISQTLNLTGKLKFLDEAIRDDLEGLNCYDRLKMWIITSTGWLFGGCEGYLVANFISGLIQEGYGTRPYIPLDYKFKVPGHDPAVQDDDYLTLTN